MYLIFDTETTGLPKDFNASYTDTNNWPRLVQIAWQLHDNVGKLIEVGNHIIKPDGFTIPYNAEKIHGISTELAQKEGKPLPDVLNIFNDVLNKTTLIIGHNIGFDINIMGAEFFRLELETVLHGKTTYNTASEVTAEFVGILRGKGKFKFPNLTELHQKLFGTDFEAAHDAAYDVAATAKCYFGLINKGIALPYDQTDVQSIAYEPPNLDKANFVKKVERKGINIPSRFKGTLDNFQPFTHLHVHTQFSILQSTSSVSALIKKAKENGMNAIAVTDHGNMHAAFKVVTEAKKQEVLLIMGCEFYMVKEHSQTKFTKGNPDQRYNQILLAKNQEAYQRLSKLCSLGFTDGYYSGYPRIDKEQILAYKEDLIALTGGMQAEIPYLILNVGEKEAEDAFVWWYENFKDDFYVSLQRHGLEEEERVNEVLLKFADKYNVKPIATHNNYYIDKSDADAHDTLLCVKEGEKKTTPVIHTPGIIRRGKRYALPNDDYYFKTQEEMNQLFSDIPISLENTQEIVGKCSPLEVKKDILMPNYKMPPEFDTQDDYLRHLAFEGAKKVYKEVTPAVEDRLNVELGIIKSMGFPGYFLIVQDFINAAKDMGVYVGPGRGCLTGDVKIVMRDGTTKPLSAVEIGDEVYANDGLPHKVLNTFKYDVKPKEELLTIIAKFGEASGVTLTKDHKILAQKDSEDKLRWYEAKDIKKYDWVFVPKPNLETSIPETLDLSEYIRGSKNYTFTDDSILFRTHAPNGQLINDEKYARYISFNHDWFKVFACFLGKGWVGNYGDLGMNITFRNEEEEKCNEIKAIFDKHNFPCKISPTRRGNKLIISAAPLVLFFDEHFRNTSMITNEKLIPEFILNAPDFLLKTFFKYLHWHLKGDVHIVYSTSKELMEQLRFICWRLSIPAALRVRSKEVVSSKGEKSYTNDYRVRIPRNKLLDDEDQSSQLGKDYKYINNGLLLRVHKVEKVKDATEVYDIEVDERHNYLTSSYLVHNSAAGSAVAYCIGITNIDPIKYNLLFERFLNPERVSMPDIDIDFDDEGRQEAINYVIEKYGKNQVAQIITYGTMAAKMAIKDVARVQDLPIAESNALAKLVPDKPGTKLKGAIAEVAELKEIFNAKNDEKSKILHEALILEGSVRNTGIHAAGVIIAPDDITKYIPVCTSKDADLLVTQFDGKVVEDAGMLKMDFLGLKTLTILRDAIRLVKENHGVTIDLDEIPLDDEKTFQLYQRGDTIGTFQFESAGMQKYLRELKPTDIEDLIAMNALYRPGPLQFIPNFIRRKHGQEEIEYPHPLLEPILKNSNGIMVYQEQIMQTAQILAGYSLGGADLLRRAMGKKKVEEMDKQEVIFVKGAKEKHNIPENKAKDVFEIMKEFAKYGFNRSHSAAYSIVAYQTAYLKANYTAEYMASVLTHNMNSIDKVTFFIDEALKLGIKVLGPDVNESAMDFSVDKEGQIRFGLGAIKGTGEAAVDIIIKERKENGAFKDVFDFTKRIDLRAVNKKSFESLIMAGAFDGFNLHRATYFPQNESSISFIEQLIKYGNAYKKDLQTSANSLFGGSARVEIATPKPPNIEPWSNTEKLNKEKEVVGFFVSGHPLDQFKNALKSFKVKPLHTIGNYDRQEIKVAGALSSKIVKTSKNGNPFTILSIEDFHSSKEIMLFSKQHEQFSDMLNEGDLLLVTGKVQKNYKDDTKYDLRLSKIEFLDELGEQSCKGILLRLDVTQIDQTLLNNIYQLMEENPGNQILEMQVQDPAEGDIKVDFVASQMKINANESVLSKFERYALECEMLF